MAFVIGVRPELIAGKRVVGVARIVTEGSSAGAVGIGPRQSVIGVEREAMGHALAIAEVNAIVVRTANRFFVANAVQPRQACSSKRGIERTRAAYPTDRD